VKDDTVKGTLCFGYEEDTRPAMLDVKSPSLKPRNQTDTFSVSEFNFTVSILVSSRKDLRIQYNSY
jgi:hypothetical protein